MSAFHDLATFQNAPQTLSATGYYLNQFFIYIKLAICLFGAITVLFGAIIAIYRYVIYRFTHLIGIVNLNGIRLDLARTIILALEFFIAGDVIETTITPDFQALGILAVLVVIRTLLNYSLHKEVKALSTIPGSGVNIND